MTPIKTEVLGKLLEASQYDSEETKFLMEGFTLGFDIGYRGPMKRQDEADNIPLRIGTKTELWNKIMKEVKIGRYAGPFKKLPFKYYVQSPIGLVPKDGGKKTRLIFHLSYDFAKPTDKDFEEKRSINYHTPKELCTVKYQDMDYALRAILKFLHKAEENEPIYIAKSDLTSAFHLEPIKVGQRCLLVMKAYDPETNEIWYFVDKCLPFGASISCKNFQRFSNALKHLAEWRNGPEDIVTNYLDDFLFLALLMEQCNWKDQNFLDLCEEIGCPVSMEKTEWATDMIVFLGLLLNGRSRSISIPQDKIQKARNMINLMLASKKTTIKNIQKLTGTLNFLNKAVVPGCTFMRMMYQKLKVKDKFGRNLKDYHHVNITGDFQDDCRVWKFFLDNITMQQICCPFIDVNAFQSATTLMFYTDTSLNPKLGYGAVFGKRWLYGQWDERFIIEEKPSIEFLELFALCAGILTWSWNRELKNTRIIIFCDNEAVMHMVNNLTTSCKQCMKLIRLLVLDGLQNNRRVFVKYVKSKDNYLADSLSRLDLMRFWRNAPKHMLTYPDRISDKLWPLQKIWFN